MTPGWQETELASNRTHHIWRSEPLYAARFDEVLKFHAPGLAPVRRGTEAWHINLQGQPAYGHRFLRTFGFYESLAAVEASDGWRHIRTDGVDLYDARYAWCGNFQGGRGPVRDTAGVYFHIDALGQSVYKERWRYAGDFRDGIAVVQREDGLSTHIDQKGRLLHGRFFLDLDVFHKGYARARDERGYTHVDERGQALYLRRFVMVEPFYNGQARVETSDGALEVIDEQGRTLRRLRARRRSPQAQLASDISAFFRPQALRAAVELGILDALPATASEVAARRELPAPHVQRLLRGLWELNIVTPGADHRWIPTEKGALLTAAHPSEMREALRVFAGEYYLQWQDLAEALRRPPAMGRTAQAHFTSRRGEPLHQHLRMQDAYARADYAQLPFVLDWPQHQRVIDAGGGLGTLLAGLLGAHSHLCGVLLDLPDVVAHVEVPAALQDRMTVQGCDFFAPWTPQADAIVLARVLHDWPDDAAQEILLRARQSLVPGPQSRVYILDRVRPEEQPAYGLIDLHMLLVTGGRERSSAEWQALTQAADLSLLEIRPLCEAASIIVCAGGG